MLTTATVLIHPATYDTVQDAVDRAFERFPTPVAGKRVFVSVHPETGKWPSTPAFRGGVSVSGAVLDAGVVISPTKFKTHGLTVLTGAIKNSYGIPAGAGSTPPLDPAHGSPKSH